ncbi:hypothetical protein BVRB_2g032940 [Beta vulgaris subsp. vulgaris]|nr:hypothetical protein BVRB_2g032940 [Beta vulgaris subsp. vulgaris]
MLRWIQTTASSSCRRIYVFAMYFINRSGKGLPKFMKN